MRTFQLTALALASALVLAGCTPPANNANPKAGENSSATTQTPLQNVQVIVEKSSRGQFKAVETFEGPAGSGLTGVMLEPAAGGGGKMVGWTNKEGTFLMPGPLFDKDATNLSEKYLNEKSNFITPDQLAEKSVGQGFIAGKSGPIVTVFFEPYCGYCNKLFVDLEKEIDKGNVRARFFMVGFLAPDSLARAADIQNAEDPYKALKKWEALKDKQKAKPSTATPEQQAKIQEYNTLMNSSGQTGTPAILYCNKTTKKVEMIKGMPSDFNAFMQTVGEEGNKACS